MARKRKKIEMADAVVPMTPMIDVVFLLLIYFVVTMKPVDSVTHLDVFRPNPSAPPKEEVKEPPKMLRISIFSDRLTFNDKRVTVDGLDRMLTRLAALDTSQSVMITCAVDAPHRDLVTVLNLCAGNELNNLSVLSGR